LDKNYYHWFYPRQYSPSFTSVHQKNGFTIITVNGERGQVKDFMHWTKAFLAKNYRFDVSQERASADGCVVARLHQELVSRAFQPAKGNALLVGDAGGFVLPVSGEGIGTAVKSGVMAADAIIRATESGGRADELYLSDVEGIILLFKKLIPWSERILAETRRGGDALLRVLCEAYQSTLVVF